MANMQDDNGAAVSDDQNQATGGGSSDNGPGEGLNLTPEQWKEVFKHDRFKELTKANKAYKKQIGEYETAAAQAKETAEAEEAEALKRNSEFEALAKKTEEKLATARDELKALRAQVTSYEELAAAQVEEALSALPEAVKSLLTPLLEDKGAIDKLKVLSEQKEAIAALVGDTDEDEEGDGQQRPPKGVKPTGGAAPREEIAKIDKKKARASYRQRLRNKL